MTHNYVLMYRLMQKSAQNYDWKEDNECYNCNVGLGEATVIANGATPDELRRLLQTAARQEGQTGQGAEICHKVRIGKKLLIEMQ